MKQFKIVFLLFLIFQTILMIWDMIRKFEDRVVYTTINGKQYEHTIPNDMSTFKKILYIVFAIVDFLILVSFILL